MSNCKFYCQKKSSLKSEDFFVSNYSIIKMNFNKKIIGFIVLGFACLIWVIMPFIGFFNLSTKQIAIYLPTLIILGEILFLIAIALLGKEYWIKIKDFVKTKWQNFKSN